MSSVILSTALVLLAQQISEPLARADYLSVMDSEYMATDANGDGRITAQEAAEKQRQDQLAQVVAANRQIFARLDQNGDGMLSPEEFLLLASPPAETSGAALMEEADLNGDGTITLVEHRTAKLARFDALDRDKDGIVTPEEAAQAQ